MIRLHDIAHSRTGDKGDISNISIIAYRVEDWPLIEREVTVARVAGILGLPESIVIRRYVLPQLGALNFVLLGVLRGGVTRSLALDAHGKCLGQIVLSMELERLREVVPLC